MLVSWRPCLPQKLCSLLCGPSTLCTSQCLRGKGQEKWVSTSGS